LLLSWRPLFDGKQLRRPRSAVLFFFIHDSGGGKSIRDGKNPTKPKATKTQKKKKERTKKKKNTKKKA